MYRYVPNYLCSVRYLLNNLVGYEIGLEVLCTMASSNYRALSKNCQMMLFSATYDQEVMEFAEMMVPNPVIIRLKREEESLDNIKQYFVKCMSREAKYKAMTNIYGICTVGQAIVFCQVGYDEDNTINTYTCTYFFVFVDLQVYNFSTSFCG